MVDCGREAASARAVSVPWRGQSVPVGLVVLEPLAVFTAPSDRTPERKAERLRRLRRKLARLGQHAATEPVGHRAPIVYRRDLPRLEPRRVPTVGGISIPLEDCLEGCEGRVPGHPPFFVVEREVRNRALADGVAAAVDRLPGGADDVCFLDVETTGLSAALVFLIGTLRWRGGRLVCRQLLARTYAEEPGIIAQFAEDVRHAPPLVSFNGKAFDVPSLRARAVVAGVALPEPAFHLDLLHEARRRYKAVLPDCRLQTLERRVCGRRRSDDIPGHDIGRAYHDFVRTGDARELARIVRHNQADLVTLAELFVRLVR